MRLIERLALAAIFVGAGIEAVAIIPGAPALVRCWAVGFAGLSAIGLVSVVLA